MNRCVSSRITTQAKNRLLISKEKLDTSDEAGGGGRGHARER